jgi:hypothetical protein
MSSCPVYGRENPVGFNFCGACGAGRRSEADEQLAAALTFYRSVGATRYVRQGEALLAVTS